MRNIKKGAAQVKFDTTAHDYGRRAAKMTSQERTDYREGAKIAVSFLPLGGVIAKLTAKMLTNAPKIAQAVKSITQTKKPSPPVATASKTQPLHPATEKLLKPTPGYAKTKEAKFYNDVYDQADFSTPKGVAEFNKRMAAHHVYKGK